MSVSYSIWPVFVIPYNLPPRYVMKQPNLILSLTIPGPKGHGNKIDVYMQPLIEELQELWDVGVVTFDASMNENFQMKAAVLSTISDFPGYANLPGWSNKGEYACPLCAFDKTSKWLDHGRKWCYMGHRRWLQVDHCWRKDTRSFDGREELRNGPIPPSGDLVLDQLKDVDFLVDNLEKSPWKKKSIFFRLPYWKTLLLCHNLDVMHIEKNICDNIVGTLLGQVGNLQKIGIREELHPKIHPQSNNTYLSKACYEMTQAEKDMFLQTLKSIRPPDEYSSNISRCVEVKERKLMGMKSYDCHMLMQEYLLIALQGTLPNHVSATIIELCDYFTRICLKDLTEADLQFLESRVVVTLCKMEQVLPPSFFTIMVHLVIHLVREVHLGGPITFRWMYPIERDLLTVKSYVNNRAYPEGSIAEGYLARENLTFCSRYLCGVETLFSRPIRNDDDDNQNEVEESNFLRPGRPLGQHANSQLSSRKRKRFPKCEIDDKSLKQAHRYVLFNVNSITPFREKHKNLVKGQNRSRRRLPEHELEKMHCENFSEWFQKRVARLEEKMDPRVMEEIKWLTRGQNNFVKRYPGYFVKGYHFHTKEHERFLRTQNSGVCDWVDTNRGYKRDEFGVALVNFSHVVHTDANTLDDPFVLASKVDKVFYAHDPKLEDWFVVRMRLTCFVIVIKIL
ncbi:hypothetical protein OSB04_011144 [Centaurea solstitialis]|uniref:DUF4218 domain-containing protein n=1 Tax=Centaurea solstitialis TaxID=347529 RepID=A0AA38T8V8_9ASTR|nr:hypothetical protein OSB04_011144 [Centaurea solstitialis]